LANFSRQNHKELSCEAQGNKSLLIIEIKGVVRDDIFKILSFHIIK